MAKWPPWSEQLWSSYLTDPGDYDGPQYPINDVIVVRDMNFTAPGGYGGPLSGFLVYLDNGAGVWYMGPGNCIGYRSYHWRGRTVFQSPQYLKVTTREVGWSWTISGFHFRAPIPVH